MGRRRTSRRLAAWRKPDGQVTGSVSPRNNERSQRRKLVIATLRNKPGSNQHPCSRSFDAGVKESSKTGVAGARPSTRSYREEKEWDRFCSMPFPRRSLIRLQPAPAEFVRKFRLPEEECVLLLRATACSLFVKAGRNSCFGSIGKRTESLGPQVNSTARFTARRHTTE